MQLRVKNVDEKSIKLLAEIYISCNNVTLQSIASTYRSKPATISNILWRGIAENILDDKVALRVYYKIVHKPYIGWHQRKLRWDEAFKQRKKVIKKLNEEIQKEFDRNAELDYLNSLKDYYESAIASYDSYFIEEEGAPSLDSLAKKLDEVNEKLQLLQ